MSNEPRGSARARTRAAGMIALSVGLHGAAWASISRAEPSPPARERIEFEVVRRERPPAPQPLPPAPAPRPRAPRREVALARPVAPPSPLASTPAAPPRDAPRPLPKVGISLGSTVATGGFAVGVGNTLRGEAGETAADPASVRPYAGGVVPAARLSSQPRPLDLPRIDYPPDARKAGTEGQVLLLLRIDARGAVTAVRVLDAPSSSLAAAADAGARRFRFAPALHDGEPVATEIRFTYTFLLE